MKIKKRWIKVKTEFRGIHNWPECPYVDVAFLRNSHRHTFKVEVRIEVEHQDREIEFFRFQHDVDFVINRLYFFEDYGAQGLDCRSPLPVELGRKSCEEIAEDIGAELLKRYSGRHLIISVSEDGEVAAEIEVEDDDVA